jgi:signal transduction histidine kinase
VSEERLRIARELHDVVAHNISLIIVRARVVLHLLDQQPDEARAALAAIKDASGETLAELRSVLGVLREADEAAPREPAPGLARLPELVDRAAQAGLDVELAIGGSPRTLPPAADLAAYRIVQEAVTNVLRHAPDAHAEVRVTYREHDVVIEIVDEGGGSAQVMADGRRARSMGAAMSARTIQRRDVPPDAGNTTGRGITGMRERVASLNGDFESGRRPGGGFRVWARLPIEATGGAQ